MPNSRPSVLEFVPACRPGEKSAKGGKTERHFLDFVVDSTSLYQTLSLSKGLDLISPLWLDEQLAALSLEAIKGLLLEGQADFPNNRRALFICPECGDLGCGAVTAIIEREERNIVWRGFGYENTYEEEVFTKDHIEIGPITFDAKQYESALKSAAQLISQKIDRRT